MSIHVTNSRTLAVVLALSLVGCGGPSPSGTDAAPAAAALAVEQRAAAEPAAVPAMLAVEAFFLERIALPAESRVSIRVRAPGAEENEILAEAELNDPGQPPYLVGFRWDPAQASGEVLVEAEIRLPDGSLRFATLEPQRLTPRGSEAIPLRLSAVERETLEAPLATGPRWVYFQCGDMPVEARFEPDGSVWLTLPDRDLRLGSAVSASGALYVADKDSFHAKGFSEAVLVVDASDPIACEATEGRSPWAAARDRGVAFRAIGVEPFWHLEIEVGEAPMIRLGRLGEEDIVRPGTALPDLAGYTAEGLRVQLFRERCVEAMSGQGYPVRAEIELEAGSERLSGCGRFLF